MALLPSTLQYCPGMTSQDLSCTAHWHVILLYKYCLFHSDIPQTKSGFWTPVDINNLTDTF